MVLFVLLVGQKRAVLTLQENQAQGQKVGNGIIETALRAIVRIREAMDSENEIIELS